MIVFRPLPPRRTLAGADLPVEAVWLADRKLGEVCAVRPFVWWWRRPGMLHFAPAPGGPHRRDCGAILLRLADRPPPPRRGIPTSARLIAYCRQHGPEEDADGPG